MGYRGLFVFVGVLVGGIAPLLPACKGPDPGAIEFEARPGAPGEPQGNSSTSSSSGGGDSGTSSGGADPNFKSAFAFHDPGVPANDPGNVNHTGQTPLQGKNCVIGGCHEAGGQPWLGAGTVYAAIGGGALPAGDNAKIELVIVDPAGVEKTTSPDVDGNFWFEASALTDGSKVAIRREGKPSQAMSSPLTAATKGRGCNAEVGCHGAATNRIYAP